MTHSMSRRIKRIERSWGGPKSCAVCRGETVLRVMRAGEPEPDGCPGCGKISKLVVLHRAEPPEFWKPREYSEEPLA